MDDLDDVLGDLLGTDDDAGASSYKPSAVRSPPGRGAGPRGGRGRAAPNSKKSEDDFYSSLAAQADDMSDVSDADPDEMAKSLAGLDDMDDALFGGSNKPKPKSPAAKTPPAGNGLSKRGIMVDRSNSVPSSPLHQPRAQSPKSVTFHFGDGIATELAGGARTTAARPKKAAVDFDEDDPLAGLLSDDEDDKPKKSNLKSTAKKQESMDDDDAISTASSRRLEIDRPPTRSGKELEDAIAAAQTKKPTGGRRRNDDITFDDDDVLGGMGLDSPRASVKKKPTKSGSEDHREGGAKSILDDLLGTGSVNKHLERPGTGERRELPFEKKLSGGAGRKKEPEQSEEDFLFGDYKPSSATGGSRPGSKRSVRFEDEDDFFGTKPSSAPAGRRRGASSLMEDMVNKDDRDWLDIASGAPSTPKKKEDDDRPKSAGTVLDQPSNSKTASSGPPKSEPVDWLGLARLGSPDTTPREKEEEESPPPAPAKKPAAKQDDYLGFLDDADSKPATKPPTESTAAAKESGGDDWLSRLQAKKDQRRKTLDDEVPSKPAPPSGGNDWLGLKDDTPADDWLGGGEVDIDAILGSSGQPTQKRADDIFSTPAKRETNLPFMKSGDSPQSRRRDKSPSGQAPPSLADSPRGLNATLDALVQMEQKPSGSNFSMTAPMPSSSGMVDLMQQQAAMASADARNQGEMFKQQQELMEQQQRQQQKEQEQALAQQKNFQVQLQQQLQAQQEQLRKQQEQQLLAMQQKQQNMMQMPSGIPQTNFSLGSGMGMMSGMGMYGDAESIINRLQAEKMHLQSMLETIKQQHNEEVKILDDSYKKRVELYEDSFGKRESRLKEENELLSKQSMDQLKLVEQEKADVISSQIKRQDQWEREKERDVDRLKEIHRNAIADLRQEQDESLQRLRKAKDQEIEAVISSHEHARHLKSVIDRVDESARDLGDLHQRVEGHHSSALDKRESAARARDQHLTTLQDRLERQSAETEKEKARLQGLISKLEMQLTDQTREVEEEKWKVRQEESRLRSAQSGLEQEKMILMEQVQRDKMEVERMKNQLLEDQRTTLAQLSEERRQLADDKAQYNVSQKLKHEQELRDSSYKMKSDVEVESTVRALNDEKARLERIAKDLELDRQKILAEKDQYDQQRQLLNVEKQKLEQLALQVRQRSHDIEDVCTSAAKAQEEGSQALALSRKSEFDQQQKMTKVTREMAHLREKEKQIAQERLSLARDKQDLEKNRSNMLCVSCRTPMRDGASNNVPNQPQAYQPKLSQAAQVLMNNLGPSVKLNNLDHISQAIETDRSVRKWKMAADKDKRYLEEESMFLEAIRHTPYSNPAGSS